MHRHRSDAANSPADEPIVEEAESSLGEDEGVGGLSVGPNESRSMGCPEAGSASPIIPPAVPPSFAAANSASGRHKEEGARQRFGKFFFHSGTLSFCLRTALVCGLLVGFGTLAYFKFRTLTVGHVPLCYTSLILGGSLLGLVLLLLLIHLLVVFCHQHRLFYTWNFIHYVSELEKYIALMLSMVAYLVALSFNRVQSLTDHYLFGSPDLRYLFIKIAIGVLLTTGLLALKRHYITGLAMAFNYSNYRDRIRESLFADRVLNMLQKSRHTYKFRQKLAQQSTTGAGGSSSLTHRSTSPHRYSDVFTIIKSGRLADPDRTGGSVRSAMDLFGSPPSSTRRAEGSPPIVVPRASTPPPAPSPGHTTASPSFLQSPTTADDGGRPRVTTTPPGVPARSVASYLTESDKKRQFSEFFRLANQMIARFSNVTDYRLEIQSEAKRTSRKLYKYLKPGSREYLLGQDLSPFIEDPDEFCRAVSLIRKNAEGSYQSLSMSIDECSDYAFGAQDLCRAIDGILTELFVTAKSLQTIETALDKVDFFFTLLVGLIMVIVVAIVVGDAVKLLLAFSTMLSGAAFAFGTSAKNMFESMIFILVIHPFDVGDRVFVPLGTTMASVATTAATMSGVDALDNVVVAEMHLLSTVFERWDGVKLYVPNYILAGKPIFNIRRSGAILELQRIHIDFSTPVAKIEELRRRMEEYVKREQSDYTELVRVMIDSMENCNRINLNVIYQHTANWQDMDAQLARRSKMLSWIKETIEQLEISYMPPVQRVAIVPAALPPGARGGENLHLLTAGEISKLMDLAGRSHQPPPV